MAEDKKYKFLISDESVNSYGFRVLTEGIDTSLFEKNPIALWMHKRPWGWDKEREPLPIGKWELAWEGKKLYGYLTFDEDDEFAVKLKNKVDKGIINMVSPGLQLIATSEDRGVLLKGQTRPTVVKCMLLEVSLVDRGSNYNALRLQDITGSEINLSDSNSNHLLPLLNDIKNQNDNMEFKTLVAKAVNLTADASEADILAAVQNAVQKNVELVDLSGQITTLSDEKKELQDQLKVFEDAEKQAEDQKRIDLVDGAVAAKKITASEKETYLSLAAKDFDSTKKILDGMQGTKELDDNGGSEVTLSAWDQRMNEINKNLKNR